MSDEPDRSQDSRGQSGRKPRPRTRKGASAAGPGPYQPVSLWVGRSRGYEAERGSLLLIDPGQVAASLGARETCSGAGRLIWGSDPGGGRGGPGPACGERDPISEIG